MSYPKDLRLESVFDASIALHRQVRMGRLQPIIQAIEAIVFALSHGQKLLIFGNGGSAADAQHFAAELVGRFQIKDRKAFPALALTTDTSVLTSIGNDDEFGHIFTRQIEALGQPGDVAFGMSTSGHSPNVYQGLSVANAKGLVGIGLTGGDGGEVGRWASIHINVPSTSTARVQEVHRTILHGICELVEEELCTPVIGQTPVGALV